MQIYSWEEHGMVVGRVSPYMTWPNETCIWLWLWLYIYMIWYVIWYVIWISEYVYDNLASCFLLDKQRVAYNQGHEITINPGYLCYVELWMSCPEHSKTIQDHIIDVNKIIKSYTSYTTSIKSFMFQVMQCIPSYIILLYYHIESYYIIEPSHHHP